jgi:integrase/recombinase XerD
MAKKHIGPDNERLKALYLQHLTLRNLSIFTIRQMEQSLRLFLGFLASQGINHVSEVDRRHFEAYKVHMSGYVTLRGQQLARGTVRSRLFNVQGWFRFMRKRGFLPTNPIADVQPPRHVRRLPAGVLRPDEIRRVFDIPNLNSPFGYRDRTIMEVLYASGARSKEIVGMRAPDVDVQQKLIRIREGKGGASRMVPLTTTACRFLERYMREIRPELAQGLRPAGRNWLAKAGTGGDDLFLSLYGGPLTREWLCGMMRRYLFLARIERKVSPVHGIRHSVATHLLANGMDVRYVQVLLGHNSIDSTRIYTHVERDTLKRHMTSYHPRELSSAKAVPFREVK